MKKRKIRKEEIMMNYSCRIDNASTNMLKGGGGAIKTLNKSSFSDGLHASRGSGGVAWDRPTQGC